MTDKNNSSVPVLRFSEFNDDWKLAKIEDYVKRVTEPVSVNENLDYREIGIKSHGKGVFHKKPCKGIQLGNKRVYWVHPYAFVVNIVFAWEQAIALTSEKEKGMIASHRFPMYIPIDDKISLPFLLSFFKRERGKYLLGLASPGGAGRNKTLGQKDFAKLKVFFPTIQEQKKIASFLGTVDQKIELLEKKLELLKQYKTGVMQRIFSQEIRFKDDDGNDFPDWEENQLGDIGELKNGFNAPKDDFGEGYPFVNLMDIFDRVEIGDIKLGLVKATTTELEKYSLQPGDVLFVRSSVKREGVGLSCVVNKSLKSPCIFSGFIIRFREHKHSLDLSFKKHIFRTTHFRKQILSLATTSANTNINQDWLKRTNIMVPQIDEQKKIADFLSTIDQKIKLTDQQITQMREFKKGLLQQMFV